MGFLKKIFGFRTKKNDSVSIFKEPTEHFDKFANFSNDEDEDEEDYVKEYKIFTLILDCGLTPGELNLLDWTKNSGKSTDFPLYFVETMSLNPRTGQQKLLELGYIVKQKSLSKLTIPKLKEILKQYQLPVSGKKSDLIERIESNIDLSLIEVPEILVLTESGEQILKQNEGYILAYKDKALTVYDYHKYRDIVKFPNYYDVRWGYLNDQYMEHSMNKNWDFLRRIRIHQAEQLENEGKYTTALSFYLEALFIGLNDRYFYGEYLGSKNCFLKCNEEQRREAFERAKQIVERSGANKIIKAKDYPILFQNIEIWEIEDYYDYFGKISPYFPK